MLTWKVCKLSFGACSRDWCLLLLLCLLILHLHVNIILLVSDAVLIFFGLSSNVGVNQATNTKESFRKIAFYQILLSCIIMCVVCVCLNAQVTSVVWWHQICRQFPPAGSTRSPGYWDFRGNILIQQMLTLMRPWVTLLLLLLVLALLALDPLQDVVVVGQSIAAVVKRAQKRGIPAWTWIYLITSLFNLIPTLFGEN